MDGRGRILAKVFLKEEDIRENMHNHDTSIFVSVDSRYREIF